MRLIGLIAVAAVSAPLLGSCNSEHSKKPWMAYDRRCEQLGVLSGPVWRLVCHARIEMIVLYAACVTKYRICDSLPSAENAIIATASVARLVEHRGRA
jgi:hypothetical protein